MLRTAIPLIDASRFLTHKPVLETIQLADAIPGIRAWENALHTPANRVHADFNLRYTRLYACWSHVGERREDIGEEKQAARALLHSRRTTDCSFPPSRIGIASRSTGRDQITLIKQQLPEAFKTRLLESTSRSLRYLISDTAVVQRALACFLLRFNFRN